MGLHKELDDPVSRPLILLALAGGRPWQKKPLLSVEGSSAAFRSPLDSAVGVSVNRCLAYMCPEECSSSSLWACPQSGDLVRGPKGLLSLGMRGLTVTKVDTVQASQSISKAIYPYKLLVNDRGGSLLPSGQSRHLQLSHQMSCPKWRVW
jgi:hypothetical protein